MTLTLETRDLTIRFGGHVAVNRVSCTFRPGELTAIVGPNGAGKTTYFNLMSGQLAATAGSVHFGGADVTKFGAARRTRIGIGRAFQLTNLFPHLTVMENLTLAPMWVGKMPKKEAEARAMQQLERVQIAEQARKFPLQLSGGQQQRVAIARALCLTPKIMVFDEPTSALDPEMIKEVLDVMIELAGQGMTMLCVTHEMGFARSVADRIVFMDEGQVMEASTPDQFFSQPRTERGRAFLSSILDH